ncbi:MAG: alpha/beta hydrolase [Patescibacteria group bacterium]
MEYINGDVKLNYEVLGEGTPVLLIHGFGCDMNIMKGCMEPVFKEVKGFKRFYIDILGMGNSNAPINKADSSEILSILISFIEDNISENFLLVGESYGGYLSLGILAKLYDKVENVLLICPMVKPIISKRILPEKNYTEFDENLLSNIRKVDNESDIDNFCHFAVIANEYTYTRFKNEILVGMKKVNKEFIEVLSKNYSFNFDLKEEFIITNIQKPVLFLAGKQDNSVGYEDLYDMANYLPRSSFYLVDKAGHNLQIDQEDIFSDITKRWLVDSRRTNERKY